MIKIKLNNIRYKIKTRFTVEDWVALNRMDTEAPANWPKIMSIGFNQSYAKFYNISEDSMILGVGIVLAQSNNRKECKHRDFTTLSIGEFIDLDIWLVDGIEKHLDAILGVISTKTIKYIDEALYVLDQYIKFRNSTYRAYAGLFGLDENAEEMVDEDEMVDTRKVAKGWYRVIVDLADNQLLQLDKITDEPLYKTLTFLSLRKERALEEQRQQLKLKQAHDISRNRK